MHRTGSTPPHPFFRRDKFVPSGPVVSDDPPGGGKNVPGSNHQSLLYAILTQVKSGTVYALVALDILWVPFYGERQWQSAPRSKLVLVGE